MSRFYIDGLSGVDKIYFSKDGKNFSSKDSVQLNAYSANEFDAEADEFVVFNSDLCDPDEVINESTGDMTYRDSDYHKIIALDGKEYAVEDEKIYKVSEIFKEL